MNNTASLLEPTLDNSSTVKERQSVENPLFTKETRSRMRGTKAYLVLLFYLLTIVGILGFVLLMSFGLRGGTGPRSSDVGQAMFVTLSVLLIFLVSFISPAFTSGSITLEREQQTLEMLVSTLLRAREIAVAKLGSGLSFTLLLIITTAPVICLCFLFGGVSPGQVAQVYLVSVTCGVFFSVAGLFFSTVARKTSASTVLSYGTAMFFTIVLFIVFGIGETIRRQPGHQTLGEVLTQLGALNPFVGVAILASPQGSPSFRIHPIIAEVCFYWAASALLFFVAIRRIRSMRA